MHYTRGHMRPDSLCTDTVKDHKFLDTLVPVLVHVVTMHKWKIIMMSLSDSEDYDSLLEQA